MSLHKSLAKDMSPKAVKKSVVSTAAQRPLTIYPAALSVLGGVFAVFIDANVFSLAALGAGAAITSVSWLWEYFVRGNQHAGDFIRRCREELETKRRAALGQLEKDLRDAGDQRGLKQIQLFKDKYQNFVEILSRKLDPTELTYQRYLTIAEQVFLGGLDNLEHAALAMKSVSAIDVAHLESELSVLERDDSDAAKKRVAEKRARLSLRESQLLRASALLLENEKALTQLDHVSAKIADVKTKQGRAQVDLEDAMAELQHLILNTENYSR